MNERVTGIGNGTTAAGTTGARQSDLEVDIFKSSSSLDPRYSAVFEDDGTVAYAYLLRSGKIIGDVWLYNRGSSPGIRPWLDRARKPPFPNPAEFVVPGRFMPVANLDDVAFVWSYREDGEVAAIQIWIRSSFHAEIMVDSKPGKCCLAEKDGPLALRLGNRVIAP